MSTSAKPTFWQWFDGVVASSKETPIGKVMIANGFEVMHTGGGCLAWQKLADDGRTRMMVCDEGLGLGDTLDEKFLVGIYADDRNGEQIGDGYGDEVNGLDLAVRWCAEAHTALRLCRKWTERIGGGFHPDTRGASYVNWAKGTDTRMSDEAIAEYDADIEKLFLAPGDPYAYAVIALEEVQHKPRPCQHRDDGRGRCIDCGAFL